MRVSRNPDTNIRIKITTTVNKAHKILFIFVEWNSGRKIDGHISGRVLNNPQFYPTVKDTVVVKHW